MTHPPIRCPKQLLAPGRAGPPPAGPTLHLTSLASSRLRAGAATAPPGGDGAASGPELALEAILGLVDRALVGAGGQVLPAAVRDHERDVGGLALADALGRLAERRVQDRAGRDAGEDALVVEQLTDPPDGVPRPDREAGVDQRLVVQLRHEALVEVAQAVDELAVARLRRDDANRGLVLAEEPPRAHQRAGRPEARDEVRDRRQVGEDLPRGAVVV